MYTTNPKINNQITIWLLIMFCIVSIMIIVGGLTRLTDSGLSITKWQLFSGLLPPLNQNDWIYQCVREDFIKRAFEDPQVQQLVLAGTYQPGSRAYSLKESIQDSLT